MIAMNAQEDGIELIREEIKKKEGKKKLIYCLTHRYTVTIVLYG